MASTAPFSSSSSRRRVGKATKGVHRASSTSSSSLVKQRVRIERHHAPVVHAEPDDHEQIAHLPNPLRTAIYSTLEAMAAQAGSGVVSVSNSNQNLNENLQTLLEACVESAFVRREFTRSGGDSDRFRSYVRDHVNLLLNPEPQTSPSVVRPRPIPPWTTSKPTPSAASRPVASMARKISLEQPQMVACTPPRTHHVVLEPSSPSPSSSAKKKLPGLAQGKAHVFPSASRRSSSKLGRSSAFSSVSPSPRKSRFSRSPALKRHSRSDHTSANSEDWVPSRVIDRLQTFQESLHRSHLIEQKNIDQRHEQMMAEQMRRSALLHQQHLQVLERVAESVQLRASVPETHQVIQSPPIPKNNISQEDPLSRERASIVVSAAERVEECVSRLSRELGSRRVSERVKSLAVDIGELEAQMKTIDENAAEQAERLQLTLQTSVAQVAELAKTASTSEFDQLDLVPPSSKREPFRLPKYEPESGGASRYAPEFDYNVMQARLRSLMHEKIKIEQKYSDDADKIASLGDSAQNKMSSSSSTSISAVVRARLNGGLNVSKVFSDQLQRRQKMHQKNNLGWSPMHYQHWIERMQLKNQARLDQLAKEAREHQQEKLMKLQNQTMKKQQLKRHQKSRSGKPLVKRSRVIPAHLQKLMAESETAVTTAVLERIDENRSVIDQQQDSCRSVVKVTPEVADSAAVDQCVMTSPVRARSPSASPSRLRVRDVSVSARSSEEQAPKAHIPAASGDLLLSNSATPFALQSLPAFEAVLDIHALRDCSVQTDLVFESQSTPPNNVFGASVLINQEDVENDTDERYRGRSDRNVIFGESNETTIGYDRVFVPLESASSGFAKDEFNRSTSIIDSVASQVLKEVLSASKDAPEEDDGVSFDYENLLKGLDHSILTQLTEEVILDELIRSPNSQHQVEQETLPNDFIVLVPNEPVCSPDLVFDEQHILQIILRFFLSESFGTSFTSRQLISPRSLHGSFDESSFIIEKEADSSSTIPNVDVFAKATVEAKDNSSSGDVVCLSLSTVALSSSSGSLEHVFVRVCIEILETDPVLVLHAEPPLPLRLGRPYSPRAKTSKTFDNISDHHRRRTSVSPSSGGKHRRSSTSSLASVMAASHNRGTQKRLSEKPPGLQREQTPEPTVHSMPFEIMRVERLEMDLDMDLFYSQSARPVLLEQFSVSFDEDDQQFDAEMMPAQAQDTPVIVEEIEPDDNVVVETLHQNDPVEQADLVKVSVLIPPSLSSGSAHVEFVCVVIEILGVPGVCLGLDFAFIERQRNGQTVGDKVAEKVIDEADVQVDTNADAGYEVDLLEKKKKVLDDEYEEGELEEGQIMMLPTNKGSTRRICYFSRGGIFGGVGDGDGDQEDKIADDDVVSEVSSVTTDSSMRDSCEDDDEIEVGGGAIRAATTDDRHESPYRFAVGDHPLDSSGEFDFGDLSDGEIAVPDRYASPDRMRQSSSADDDE